MSFFVMCRGRGYSSFSLEVHGNANGDACHPCHRAFLWMCVCHGHCPGSVSDSMDEHIYDYGDSVRLSVAVCDDVDCGVTV